MIRTLLTLLLAMMATVLVGSPSHADEAEFAARDVPIMIMVDLSGSMNDDDGTGTIKLDGAKAALTEVAREIPTGTEMGLWTYPGSGTNHDGRCSLGEANYSLGTLEAPQLAAEVNSLRAGGPTPTGPALQATIDHMKAAGRNSGLVVLVSDGLSNCGKPPCGVAKRARAEGFDIRAAVVGFQVSQDGREELECVAKATIGFYADVTDSKQLISTVNELVGPRLMVTVKGLDGTLAGGSKHQVTVQIENQSPALTAENVTAFLSFGDAGREIAVVKSGASNAIVFPPVLPPRVMLGNLPPDKSRTNTWRVSVPNVAGNSFAQPWLTTQHENGVPEVRKGLWLIASEPLTLEDPGPILRNATKVAILGDSYSSGEGTFNYTSETDLPRNRCHRSLFTYGLSLFAYSGNPTEEDGRSIVACSGAVTQDYFQPNPGGTKAKHLPPQHEQLAELLRESDRAPDVVLLTFGGNDIGFAHIITKCVADLGADCTQNHGSRSKRGTGCVFGDSDPDPATDHQLSESGRFSSADLCTREASLERRGPSRGHEHHRTTDQALRCSGVADQLARVARGTWRRMGTPHRPALIHRSWPITCPARTSTPTNGISESCWAANSTIRSRSQLLERPNAVFPSTTRVMLRR